VTGNLDGSVRVWDATTGEPLGPPVAQRAAVLAVAFADGGRSFQTVAADASMRVWAAPAPAPEDVSPLTLRLKVRTGQTIDTPKADATGRALDNRQAVVPLSPDEWQRCRRELVELEGTAERAYDSPVGPWLTTSPALGTPSRTATSSGPRGTAARRAAWPGGQPAGLITPPREVTTIRAAGGVDLPRPESFPGWRGGRVVFLPPP
jgi:hypothetical protein